VQLADVARAAALAGLTDFDAVGLQSVRVARASVLVDAAYLDHLIEQALRSRGILTGPLTARVDFAQADLRFDAEAVPQPADLLDLRYSPGSEPFTARFHIAGIVQPVELTGSIELMTTAPRLLDSRPAGAILTAADFEMAIVPLATADAGGYAELDQLVGKQLLRQSRGGIMLKPGDVGEPTVIARNDLVTVVLQAGVMTLTIKATALGTAAAGEPIDVLNIATKKVLHGLARPDGTVEIVTATVAAL
jgi:flagella basal body P-ring formation protein FlgA